MFLPVRQGKSLTLFVGPGGRFCLTLRLGLGLGGLPLLGFGLGLSRPEDRVHLCCCCFCSSSLSLGWRAVWCLPTLSGSEFIFCLRLRGRRFRASVATDWGGLVGTPRLTVLGHRLELLERGML